MEIVISSLSVLVSLTLLNVWLLRFNKATSYRGGGAQNMRQEFQVYGLPGWMVPVIGSLKVLLAMLLITSLWIPVVLKPSAYLIASLMLAAVIMHLKAQDSFKKLIPATLLLLASLFIGMSGG
ncbi:DoxX family protein [Verrucomicrobia bacterium]|jgi:hypothetical protein|nr:DoxX family protein [Verrucomicrobiota bacterium]